jgi:hypothetical protein
VVKNTIESILDPIFHQDSYGYPFHPLYGATVQILRKPKRGDGAVSVIDYSGKRLKIPVWMLSPDSSGIRISERVHLSKEALLSLTSLLSPRAGEDRGHDNLLPTAVDGCKGGHRGATGTVGLMVREESGIVPVDATVRADVVDLMARTLVVVFQAKGGRINDRASLQSQDQAGVSGSQGHGLLTAIERETGALQPGESAPSI